VFFSDPQPYIWYVVVLRKTMPRRKCPWGITKQVSELAILRIGLFTTPSIMKAETLSDIGLNALGILRKSIGKLFAVHLAYTEHSA
jgi:hypothetical protein